MFNTNKGRFHIQTLNIRSYKNKLGQLKHHLIETIPDVLCLQETRADFIIKIPGYKLAGHSSAQMPALGTAILIREELNFVELDCSEPNDPSLELSGVEVLLASNHTIKIINAYAQARHPINTNTIKKLILNQVTPTLIVGDLNAKLDIPLHNTTNRNGDILGKLLEQDRISALLPQSYTRYDPGGHTQPSVIDIGLISADHQNIVSEPKVWEEVGSDHRPVSFFLSNKYKLPRKPQQSSRPNLDKADWQEYKNEIETEVEKLPRLQITKEGIDQAIDELTNIIKTADKNNIPRKNIPKTGLKPYPQHIVEKIQLKRTLTKRIEKHGERDKSDMISRTLIVKNTTNFGGTL